MKTTMWITMLALAPWLAPGQSVSSSASYELLHAPPGDSGGGGPVANAGETVTAEISVGEPAAGGVSEVTPGGVHGLGNLVGQLYDVTGVSVSATPVTVDELATRQFDAAATLDDATTLALDPADVSWTESSDALVGISADGLASAAPVWATTVANVGGSYGLFVDPDGFDLTVVDTGETDSYGAYGGDGIDDGWQVNYFGLPPNTDAGPGENPDHDPNDNLMEFLGGFDPTDPLAFFQLKADGFSGPATFDLRLNKVIPGRTYTVLAGSDLFVPFATTVGTPFSVAGEELDRLFQDAGAGAGQTFYQVEITRP